MCRFVLSGLACLFCLLQTTDLFSHFLFISVGPHAEAGRTAEVYFSERAQAGHPRFVGKVAHTQLWVQSEAGQFQPLVVRKGRDRLRAFLPAKGAVGVVGRCEYGVLTRNVPFLLRYYPKAISGAPQAINALMPFGKNPLEITASINGDELTLRLLKDGKPVPHATFTTVDDDLANEELKADGTGQAAWKPDAAGHYGVYAKFVEKKSGEHKGKKFSEIHSIATLAFHWPLIRKDPDPEAGAMVENAYAARAVWKNFPGFTSEISGRVDGRDFAGTLCVEAGGAIHLKIDEESAMGWVKGQLNGLVQHIRSRPSPAPRRRLVFADRDESHPQGRLITPLGSGASYRVKDGQISTYNTVRGSQNFTVLVLGYKMNEEGKSLFNAYTYQYWDAKNGQLLSTQSFQIRWKRIGAFDLPSELTEATSSAAGQSVRGYRLTKERLTPGLRNTEAPKQ